MLFVLYYKITSIPIFTKGCLFRKHFFDFSKQTYTGFKKGNTLLCNKQTNKGERDKCTYYVYNHTEEKFGCSQFK